MLRRCLVLASLFISGQALADASTVVSLGPWYTYAEPYLVALFVAVVMALGGIIWQQLQARLKILRTQQAIDIESKAAAAFQTALTNAAGRWLANQEGNVANMKVDVHSAGIAEEVDNVQKLVPQAIEELKITPDVVASVVAKGVVGKIGLAQATIPAPPPSVVSGPNADTAVVINNPEGVKT